jgi:WD40 repeat protein
VKVWDTTTGQLEIDQQTNMWQLRFIAFTPDGKRMALAGFDGTVRLLDAAGREMLRIFAHPITVTHAVFNHDGTKLATGHNALVTGVAFSRDNRWLASASWDGTVKLWEASASGTPGGAPRHTLRGHTGNVTSVAISPDNRTLATGSWDKTVKLWDLQAPMGDSLTELRTIACTERVMSIAFSPDGRLLAIGQMTRIGLHDPVSGKAVTPFKPTVAPVPALAFSPDSRHLVAAGASDPAIGVWDVAGEKLLIEIRRDPAPNSSVDISPDGRFIAAPGPIEGSARAPAKIWEVDWDAKTYKDFLTLSGHSGHVFRLAFSPDGRYLASGSWDSTIKIWDLKALAQDPKAEPATLRGHAGPIFGLTFSPDGRRLASGSGFAGYGEVKVWDATLWENKANEQP